MDETKGATMGKMTEGTATKADQYRYPIGAKVASLVYHDVHITICTGDGTDGLSYYSMSGWKRTLSYTFIILPRRL